MPVAGPPSQTGSIQAMTVPRFYEPARLNFLLLNPKRSRGTRRLDPLQTIEFSGNEYENLNFRRALLD